ncbi:MAG: hypothetical protein K2Q23_03450 [Bryobacteraceae bacterium]|nr:hypothetical protein [Bryobacteraceae bacterium]
MLNGIARTLLTGPLASIAQTLTSTLQSVTSTGGGAQNNLLGKLFGFSQNTSGRLSHPALRPPVGMPSPFQLPGSAFQNLTQSMTNMSSSLMGMNQNMSQLLGIFSQLMGQSGFGMPQSGFGYGMQQPSFGFGMQQPSFGFGMQPSFGFGMQQPFMPQPFGNGYQQFLTNQMGQLGDRAANLTGQAMSLHQESAEMRQARSLVQAARPLLLNNNPKDQARGERMLAQAKQLASEDPKLGRMIDDAAKLSRSSNPRDRLKAAALLNRTEKRMNTEAFRDSFTAQHKLGQASQMIDRMSQYANLLAQTQQFAYSSYRY